MTAVDESGPRWAVRRPRAVVSGPQHDTAGPLPLPRAPEEPRIVVGAVGFDRMTEIQVVRKVMDALSVGTGGVIVTPNVDILVKCQDPQVAHLFRQADIVVADGAPVVLTSRLARRALPGRVAGSSLVLTLSTAARDEGRSVFLLGGNAGVASAAGRRLRVLYPGIRVVGTACPALGFEADPEQMDALEKQVVAARPDLVFVALGAPKQEKLSYHLSTLLPGAWFLGCGGSLSMVAGEVRRAPVWMQDSGLEWVYRLTREPRRLARRYLVDDLPFAVRLVLGGLVSRHAQVGVATLAEIGARGAAERSGEHAEQEAHPGAHGRQSPTAFRTPRRPAPQPRSIGRT